MRRERSDTDILSLTRWGEVEAMAKTLSSSMAVKRTIARQICRSLKPRQHHHHSLTLRPAQSIETPGSPSTPGTRSVQNVFAQQRAMNAFTKCATSSPTTPGAKYLHPKDIPRAVTMLTDIPLTGLQEWMRNRGLGERSPTKQALGWGEFQGCLQELCPSYLEAFAVNDPGEPARKDLDSPSGAYGANIRERAAASLLDYEQLTKKPLRFYPTLDPLVLVDFIKAQERQTRKDPKAALAEAEAGGKLGKKKTPWGIDDAHERLHKLGLERSLVYEAVHPGEQPVNEKKQDAVLASKRRLIMRKHASEETLGHSATLARGAGCLAHHSLRYEVRKQRGKELEAKRRRAAQCRSREKAEAKERLRKHQEQVQAKRLGRMEAHRERTKRLEEMRKTETIRLEGQCRGQDFLKKGARATLRSEAEGLRQQGPQPWPDPGAACDPEGRLIQSRSLTGWSSAPSTAGSLSNRTVNTQPWVRLESMKLSDISAGPTCLSEVWDPDCHPI
ncbi:unnamed protein product [Chrysoparadoxa australica]